MPVMRRLVPLLLLMLPAPALADAIPRQPPCPPGSTRVIDGHQVIYCDPSGCDEDCACRPMGLCVEEVTREISSSFPAMPGDTMRTVRWRDARSSCEAGSTCPGGTACEVAPRCAAETADHEPDAPPAAEAPPEEAATPVAEGDEADEGGGCAASAGGASSVGVLFTLALGLAFARGASRRR